MRPRVVHAILLLLTLTALAVCWSGLPMIWDGAYQFAATVWFQEPYVYLTRFHTWALWQPLVVLGRHTEDFTLLSCAFGLPFCLAPAVSLGASCRTRSTGLSLESATGLPAATSTTTPTRWRAPKGTTTRSPTATGIASSIR